MRTIANVSLAAIYSEAIYYEVTEELPEGAKISYAKALRGNSGCRTGDLMVARFLVKTLCLCVFPLCLVVNAPVLHLSVDQDLRARNLSALWEFPLCPRS